MAGTDPPVGASISYSRQYRRCGRAGCLVCGPGLPGHGPYWYAFWRENGRKRSRYLGKVPPADAVRDWATPDAAPDQQAGSALRVRTLGGFAVWEADAPVPVERWGRRKVGALFKCLLSAPGNRLHRDQAIELLWPEATPDTGATNLRATVHRLRQALGNGDYIRYRGEVLALVPGIDITRGTSGWLDADAFAAAAHAALVGHDPAACRAALSLYGGEYLPEDIYEEWTVARREELRGLRTSLLLHLAALCIEIGESEEAEGCLRTVLVTERCHEEAALALMRLYVAAGRSMHAIRVYERLAAALRDDLDLLPDPEARALYQSLVAQRAATRAAAGLPERRLPTNLPASLTSFIGRRREIAALRAVLCPAGEAMAAPLADQVVQCRLLTLTGPGGCGKTRLALQTADELLEEYTDGVWLVELAALPASTDADTPQVPRAVAAALGLRDDADRPPTEALVEYLRRRHLLLVLDNCEHLLEGCAAMATSLLRGCPALQILATSREALGIAGEQPWTVPPLSLPDVATVPVAGQLLEYEAVRLFLDRARLQQPTFELTDHNAAAVAGICRRLDGLPLAIELAAARVGTLDVAGLAARLHQRFRLLTSGPRSAPTRQQTLRATLDWSYDLLGEGERTLLHRLAVFKGGCTLEAAEAVCGDARRGEDDDGGSGPDGDTGRIALLMPEDVLDTLAGLVRKSLLAPQDQDGLARYRLLETVHQYGLERLVASGEQAVVAWRHCAFFLNMAECAEREWQGPGQRAWLARLDQEGDNLRAALGWARSSGETELGIRLAGALWRFWRTRGYLSEGRDWLEDLLGEGGPPSTTRARALLGAGALARDQGDLVHAAGRLRESLTMARAAGDREATAAALSALGTVVKLQGDLREARRLSEESLVLCREDGNCYDAAIALDNLANIAMREGDYGQSLALHQESLALRRELGDLHGVGVTLNNMAIVAYQQGHHAQSAAWLEESLAMDREMGDKEGLATSLGNLGSLLLDMGEIERALPLFAEGLILKRDVGDRDGIAYNLFHLAQASRHQGRMARAARLLGAAAAQWSSAGVLLPQGYQAEVARTTATVREALGDAEFAAAWSTGQAMTIERTIAFALEDAPGIFP